MRIVELILDEAQEMMGIDAISIVESPAIQEDFVALNSEEIKLAEVSKEKKILMGALLVPNKPIYRKNGDDEYYIYFSKDTIAKASQLYLKNGYQGNSTLEHANALQGLTLVESWLVEDEVNDKSRKYGMNVPVGTWMGAVKVDNDEVWNEYVKTNKVRGFSIEGYFADKMEQSDKSNKEDMEEVEAAQLLSAIEKIVRGEKVELALIDDAIKFEIGVKEFGKNIDIEENQIKEFEKNKSSLENSIEVNRTNLLEDLSILMMKLREVESSAKELGVNPNSIPKYKDALKTIEYGKKQVQKSNQLSKRIK
jgi:hypothetical protein